MNGTGAGKLDEKELNQVVQHKGLTSEPPWIADAFYVAVALMWFIPDKRIERDVRGHA